jgi:hypothetical protein
VRSLLVVLTVARTASAQPVATDPVRQADEAVRRGLEATTAGDHTAALAAFREAAELVPDANLPHKLAAEALEALDRPGEAIAEYRLYIAIKPDARGVEEVRARIARLAATLPGELAVHCDIAGATIVVDGESLGPAPIRVSHRSGPVAIEISASGFLPQRAHLDIAAGQRSELTCELARRDDALAIAPARPPPHAARSWYRRWSVIVPVVGAAALAATIGAVAAFGGAPPNSDGGVHHFP